jgi:BMFP domain-containing protein YqiC
MGESDFLNDDWLEAQRNYWAEWSARAGQSGGGAEPALSPWEQALNQWWQSLAPTAPRMVQELLEKTLAQGRQLFQLAEQFAATRQRPEGGPDWQAAAQQTIGDLRGIIAGITASMRPLPEAVTEGSADYLQRLSALPGLGLGQRSQAQQREVIARLLRFQKAHQAYELFFVDLGKQAIARLQDEIARLDGQGETLDSARALYDLWVSVCEGVYAEQVMTPAYVELYAELINSQMALKQQLRDMLDDSFTLLGMPTTRDFRAQEQRAHQDRQALRALQAEVAAMRRTPAKKRAGPRKRPAAAGK